MKETVAIEPEAVRSDPSLYGKIAEERTFEVYVIPPQLFKREIVPEVSAPSGSQPSAAVGTGAEADRRRRLHLGRPDRMGSDRKVSRSLAVASPGKDTRTLVPARSRARHRSRNKI